MRVWKIALALIASVVVLPCAAFAQASLTGVVKDSSGAVIAGVTVEASSDVLIERSRSVTTDGTGQYKIVDLRPGTYTVTFAQPGFRSTRRDGIELTGSFTTALNAELIAGAIDETIVVTGMTPIVDLQSTTKQRVLGHDVIDTVPTGRLYSQFGLLVPGVSSSAGTSNQDVGGASGDIMVSLVAHGSKTVDMRVTQNGVTTATLQAGGGIGMSTPNIGAAQEVTVDTGSVSAELATGGPRINFIPRDGGNTFKGFMYGSGSANSLQRSNFTQDLKDRGMKAADSIDTVLDLNPGLGGPLQKDRLWFFSTGRYQLANNFVGGMFYNLNANNPNVWNYVPDETRQGENKITTTDAQVRVTLRATPRNKFAGTLDQQTRCNCPFFVSATRSPEAGNDRRSPSQHLLHGEWTSPITNRLLMEAVVLYRTERWGNTPPALEGFASGTAPGMISVVDQGGSIPNLQYRGGGTANGTYNNNSVPNYFYRGAASYITGSHAFKVGFNDAIGYLTTTVSNFQPLAYRFKDGLPNQITEFATPYTTTQNQDHDFGIFVQDTWSLDRLTLSGGMRFDYFKSSFPAQTLGPSLLDPTRNLSFNAQDNLNWKDVTPRMGAVYDLFGTGQTAVRVSLNKYLSGQGLNALGINANPINLLSLSTTRTWNDSNKNFAVDCTLTNPAMQNLTAAGGDNCGAFNNSTFLTTDINSTFSQELLTGWNHRPSNWEFSTGIQQQLLPRVSIDVAYFRRWFSNFQVTDNTLVAPADFTEFSFTTPVDGRLDDRSGVVIGGLRDVNSNKVGQVLNLNTLSDKYGKQIEHWNGVDIALNTRFSNGVLFQGGVATGHRLTDNCEIVQVLPEMLIAGSTYTPQANCRVEEPWLTQAKFAAAYLIPGFDVQVSGTYQSVPGPELVANQTITSNQTTLGRSFTGSTNATVNMLVPATHYGERLHQVDLRFGKILRFGQTRTAFNVDLYNALNANTVLTEQSTFNSAISVWRTPQSILTGSFVKFTMQFDF